MVDCGLAMDCSILVVSLVAHEVPSGEYSREICLIGLVTGILGALQNPANSWLTRVRHVRAASRSLQYTCRDWQACRLADVADASCAP